MKLTARIDEDIKSFEAYFSKLFGLIKKNKVIERGFPKEAYDAGSEKFQGTNYQFSHHIKPGMVIDIYCAYEYWIHKTCKLYQKRGFGRLSAVEIGKGERGGEHFKCRKYLTECVKIDIKNAMENYKALDALREVRNVIVHSGCQLEEPKSVPYNASKKEKKRIENNIKQYSKSIEVIRETEGVSMFGSLITVTDDFILQQLKACEGYLLWAAGKYKD